MFESHAIVGRIGSIRYSEKRQDVVNLSIAVQRGKETTTWWEIALWEDQKELFEKLSVEQGTLIALQVHGVYADAYIDRGGKPQASIKATGHLFRLLSGKKSDEETSAQEAAGSKPEEKK
jgi:hypothetical protein